MPHLDANSTVYQGSTDAPDNSNRIIVHVPGSSLTAWTHDHNIHPDAPTTSARVFSNGRQNKPIIPKETKKYAACVDVVEPAEITVHMDRADFLKFADDIAQAAAKLQPKSATTADDLRIPFDLSPCPTCGGNHYHAPDCATKFNPGPRETPPHTCDDCGKPISAGLPTAGDPDPELCNC